MSKITFLNPWATSALAVALVVSVPVEADTIQVSGSSWDLADGARSFDIADVSEIDWPHGQMLSDDATGGVGVHQRAHFRVLLEDELRAFAAFIDAGGPVDPGIDAGPDDPASSITPDEGDLPSVAEPVSLVLLGLTLVGGWLRLRRQ